MSSQPKTRDPWPIRSYTPRHFSWPYIDSDFTRQDPTPDTSFYSSPRFVTHLDDAAITSLKQYYESALPRRGRILDVCSSWISHFPPAVEEVVKKGDLQVSGIGMNRAELAANPVLSSGRVVADLNEDPDIAAILSKEGIVSESDTDKLDASTNVVSIDYLIRPVEVLRSLRRVTKQGGRVHLVISNRCFPTKVINRWMRISEEERLLMVSDYLHFAGWKQIEIVELSNGKIKEPAGGGLAQGGLMGLFGGMGIQYRDPLWVVRAVNE
ncbi:hypothetical protein HD806DRAFT_357003 [Xylariaceae sp. AK1471]|nr:hypothetical protein HD806DRAFT_357003 [Xylariaceae sp. AK1471]